MKHQFTYHRIFTVPKIEIFVSILPIHAHRLHFQLRCQFYIQFNHSYVISVLADAGLVIGVDDKIFYLEILSNKYYKDLKE